MAAEHFGNLDETSETIPPAYPDDDQEVDIPSTPGFGMSPITPKTPTPTSTSISFKGYGSKANIPYYGDPNRAERELDPSTIFVGGLERFGPDAWDEAKVGNFFAKFGGLENVKVVRPSNSRSAFAFVKFNNIESPARAVLEEHNRIYEGRAMRVQLRDCNPPHRGAWRSGRVRGRYLHQHFGTQRCYPDPTRKSPEGGFAENYQHQESSIVHQYDDPTSGNDDTYVPSFVTLNNSGNRENTTSRQSSPQQSTAPRKAFNSQSEGYREWYDESTTVALTPPPSSFGSSASVTTPGLAPATSYPISTAGCYPSPWMQPQQMSYPIPYFDGYPGYPMPGQQVAPEFASPAWPAMGGMCSFYVPYSGYPPRPPNADQSQQRPNGQAPLLPTGFIQNEQGTLIAVYQREALDQYMAAAQLGPLPLSQPQPQNTPPWPQYPEPHLYPFHGPVPHMMSLPYRQFQTPSQTGTNASWIPIPSPLGLPPSQHAFHHSAHPTNVPNPTSTFRGGYHDTGGQPNAPSFRRQQQPGRRDQHNTFNNPNRNNHSRPHANRNPAGSMKNTGQPQAVSQQPLIRPAQYYRR